MQMIYGQKGNYGISVFILLYVMLVAVDVVSAQSTQSVAVEWNPNPELEVVGYNIYYGQASGQYSQEINAGSGTSSSVGGLTPGSTYYFVVTAYDDDGVESLPSAEISYTVPADAPVTPPGVISSLQVVAGGGTQMTITLGTSTPTAQGSSGSQSGSDVSFQTVDIQYSNDLSTWTVLKSIPYSAGSVNFVDSGASGVPRRFYRLVFH